MRFDYAQAELHSPLMFGYARFEKLKRIFEEEKKKLHYILEIYH